MTGFIRGFFSKPQSNDAEAPAPIERPTQEKAIRQPKTTDAFFLEPNDAQTFGNLEYMKASKKIRRTFPKTLDSPEEKEYIQELSALGRLVNGKPQIEIAAVESPTAETSAIDSSSTARRSAGTDLDLFRKMAKDMRK